MKKHFAKYLPVEGDVKGSAAEFSQNLKIGMTVLCTQTGKVGKIEKIDEANGHLRNIRLHSDDNCTWFCFLNDHTKGWPIQKVKLFLCSRDIHVGDKISSDDLRGTHFAVDSKWIYIQTEDGHTWSRNPHECFKVIGEISPEATWVKEGDEFDKEDLMANGIGQTWDNTHKNLKFRVKGPCGHFH